MDAEEFMMHGFDSDVSDDGDEPEKTSTGKVSATDVGEDSSQQQKKYKIIIFLVRFVRESSAISVGGQLVL